MVSSRYMLYGMSVDSDLPLPLPPAEGCRADLTIRWLGLERPFFPSPSLPGRIWESRGGGWNLRYNGRDGDFLAFHFNKYGSSLAVSHCTPYHWQDFVSILLGPGVGAALHLKKVRCLHGSAVTLDEGAILILGDSEAGKSTLAATLANLGHSFLCEEIAVLAPEGKDVLVLPGHPLLKLSTRSVEALGESPEALPLVFPTSKRTDERWLDARLPPRSFHDTPARLRAVYLLAGRRAGIQAPLIFPMPPARAALSLIKFSYGRQWLHTPPEETLRFCALVAGSAPVRQVWLPDGLDTATGAARALVEDALQSVHPPVPRYESIDA